MNRQKYQSYLKTDYWRSKRREQTKKYPQCYCCGSRMFLQVHHRTYRNLGDEQGDDLQTLCKYCHERVHQFANTRFKHLRTFEDRVIASAEEIRNTNYVVYQRPKRQQNYEYEDRRVINFPMSGKWWEKLKYMLSLLK